MSALPEHLLALAHAHEPACHGYANGCACARCADRSLRFRDLACQGRPNAATEAMRQSAQYFETPWRFGSNPDGPPMPLGSAFIVNGAWSN